MNRLLGSLISSGITLSRMYCTSEHRLKQIGLHSTHYQHTFTIIHLFDSSTHAILLTRVRGDTCVSVALFFFQHLTERRLNFNRTWCPDVKTIGHQTCRKQDLWLWTKLEKPKITSLTISPGTAAKECFFVVVVFSGHEVTFSSPVEPTKHTALWLRTAHGCLLQQKHGAPSVQMHLPTCLCFAMTWDLNLMVGK